MKMKPNDKAGLHQALIAKVFIPSDSEHQLFELVEENHRWIQYIREQALKIQPDLNEEGIQSAINGVVGEAIGRLNRTNPNSQFYGK